jgi:hypothetical protein
MTDDALPERPFNRRRLLRGGAVLAGATGVSAVSAAFSATSAEAATGQFMVVGQPNSADLTTTITTTNSATSPTLTLTNSTGPTLRLTPTGYTGALARGEIANKDLGPEIGVDGGAGVVTSYLATGLDLDEIPIPVPIVPQRMLDTRTPGGRAGIKTTSPNAFDSKFRLKAGAWVDVALAASSPQRIDGAYINVTAVQPVTTGFIVAYPPGERPATATVNFASGQVVGNGAFILTGVAAEDPGWYVIRLYSTSVTHVVMDLTGLTMRGLAPARPDTSELRTGRTVSRASRMKRVFHFR